LGTWETTSPNGLGAPSIRSLIANGWETTNLIGAQAPSAPPQVVA